MDKRRICGGDVWLLAAVLAAPLFAMAALPLMDTSEPRYAEIAHLMAQSGDWITPWFSPGVPFWGKPPLSFWAQAAAIKLLGLGEFALRLPSWLCWLATCAVLFAGVRRVHGARTALWAVLIYATSALSAVCAGAVLTEPFLALGTTLSLVAFAVVAHGAGTPFWRYGFFVGLAIGLLAKGPLAVVLCVVPIFVREVWQRWMNPNPNPAPPANPPALAALPLPSLFPWIRGLLLVAALTLPWYVAAEIKTPGFLHYFIVGEHVLRFVDPGWAGDRYGTAHSEVSGTIWLYGLWASFPWGIGLLALALAAACKPRLRTTLRARLQAVVQHRLWSWWLACALCAPVFFTFSANILWTYVLPALAGFSVLAALCANACAHARRARHCLRVIACIVPVCVLGVALRAVVLPETGKTERGLVRYARIQQPHTPLYYLGPLPFSARFYSRGAARHLAGETLENAVADAQTQPFYLAVPRGRLPQLEATLGRPLVPQYSNRRYILVHLPH